MMKRVNKILIAFLAVICILGSTGISFAAYNTVPDKKYPTLEEAEIASGDSEDVEIHLKFSNNVGCIDEDQEGRYDMTGINEENLTKFSMVAADDVYSSVAITVTPHPDAEMQTEESKYFFIFADDLDVDKEYVITVDKDLYANMGNSLAVDYEIRFTIATGDIDIDAMGKLPEEEPTAPLYLVETNVEMNATDVDLSSTIVMTFAYNVSGPEVLDFNKSCVSLLKGEDSVSIDITAGEDVKQIVIKPKAALDPSTEYRLVVTKDLMAKNGSTLSSPVNLYFTTTSNSLNSSGVTGGSGGTTGDSTTSTTNGAVITSNQAINANASTTLQALYFPDIENSWAQKEIDWLADRGIITGNPNGKFLPNNTITRAEIVAILVRALDLKSDGTVPFKDVSNHWSQSYVAAAASQGIISGFSDSTFAPDSMVTREQLAEMIVRAGKLNLNGKTPITFSDDSQISSWASEAIKTASANGIIQGYSDSTFRPKNNVTRAEACSMIANLLKLEK